jgi:hypothetical protein
MRCCGGRHRVLRHAVPTAFVWSRMSQDAAALYLTLFGILLPTPQELDDAYEICMNLDDDSPGRAPTNADSAIAIPSVRPRRSFALLLAFSRTNGFSHSPPRPGPSHRTHVHGSLASR